MSQFKSTLEQWRILHEVVEAGSYLKAADKLHRSHSSLNHAVSKLQRQLGVPLVEVKGRRLLLTPIGEQLLRRARLILDEAHALESLAKTIEAGWESEITIAVDIQYPRELLADVLQQFAPDSRGVWLNTVDVFLGQAGDFIRDATADLVISEVLPEGYVGDPVYRVDMIPVAHKDHPIFADKEPPIRLRELRNYLQITPINSDTTRSYKTGWQKSQQRWVVSNFDAALSLLLGGTGFGWITAELAEPYLNEGTLKSIDLEEGPGYKGFLYLIAPRAEELGPAGKLLSQLFKSDAKLRSILTPTSSEEAGLPSSETPVDT
jgi:DNA-binding transcriptional LysR family regulator